MNKLILYITLFYVHVLFTCAFSQTLEEKNTIIAMDFHPVLQLYISGSEDINFEFNEISEYQTGIVRYGATVLAVNATVNWDLYAVGFSSAGTVWEQQIKYGAATDPNAENILSLHALELHQNNANPSATGASPSVNADYSSPFTSSISVGRNSIYTSSNPYIKPLATDKYIAGHASTSDFITGGSYLINNNSGSMGASGNFYYIIDYRIKPGLPPTFPNSGTNSVSPVADGIITPGHYLQPGIYTCSVKYILTENN
ncbi:MAG: hypothetical protein WAQ28_17080 [Bacteroidia bacterium]|jgi:hypothetical protein